MYFVVISSRLVGLQSPIYIEPSDLNLCLHKSPDAVFLLNQNHIDYSIRVQAIFEGDLTIV